MGGASGGAIGGGAVLVDGSGGMGGCGKDGDAMGDGVESKSGASSISSEGCSSGEEEESEMMEDRRAGAAG